MTTNRLKALCTGIALIGSLSMGASSALAQGSNNCAGAEPLSGDGLYQFDNGSATTDGNPDAACNEFNNNQVDNDVWFCWTAGVTGTCTMQTCGTTGIDTKLAVYDGCGCPEGTAILGCNDDTCGLQSRVDFPCVAGNSYLIRVGTFPGAAGGAGQIGFNTDPLNVQTGGCCYADSSCVITDAANCANTGGTYFGDGTDCTNCGITGGNDNCASPVLIVGPGTFQFDNSSATVDGVNNPACNEFGSEAVDNDVWFAWQAAADGLVTVSTCGSTTVDTKLAVYDGTSCPQGSGILDCNDDTCGLQSEISFTAVDGNLYLLRVGTFPGAAGGTGSFSVIDEGAAPTGACCLSTTTCADAMTAVACVAAEGVYQGDGTFCATTDCSTGPTGGPDVIVGDLPNISTYSAVGTKRGYAIGTTSCNVGTDNLLWIANGVEHPVIGQNFYALHNNANGHPRFVQIGQSWLKHGFTALTGNVCDTCSGVGGSVLGIGCSDPYSSGLNGSQGGLGPKFEVNATTGTYQWPYTGDNQTGDSIYKRIQVESSDITGLPAARYFAEGHYVTPDDARWNNGLNNASYREFNFTGGGSGTSFVGSTAREKPAIVAWKDIDPTVTLTVVDYTEPTNPVDTYGSGISDITARFFVAANAYDNGNGTWDYEYAVFNLNSDRSADLLVVPHGSGNSITNIGFRDVDYHSGEPFSGTDWPGENSASAVTWTMPSEGTNSNALRYSSCYSFWFTSNAAPVSGTATLSLFKSGAAGAPDELSVDTVVPGNAGGAPTGACCFTDGSCSEVTSADCTNGGGAYLGDGVSCATANCPQPTGACCFIDGTCSEVTAADCGNSGGSYQGDAISCATANCPQPSGACCFIDGSCSEITASSCASMGGTYTGDFISCAAAACPQPTGACCFGDGSCSELTAADCANGGGTYSGDFISCAAANCPQPTGSCCVSGVCSDLIEDDCIAQGGIFGGVGTDCGTTVCETCPCDWTEAGGLNSDDFFAFLDDFFTGNADFNNDSMTNSDDFFSFLDCFFTPPSGC